jgi:hypothetical protein
MNASLVGDRRRQKTSKILFLIFSEKIHALERFRDQEIAVAANYLIHAEA